MIKIKVKSGDDIQVYSFEKGTSTEEIKAALIADKHESSNLNIRDEVETSMDTDLRGSVNEEMRRNTSNPIKPLLDLIAANEASIHGYEQTNGPQNKDNLTKMTFAEVMEKQDRDYYRNKPNATSNAVGRYQFIPTTLAETLPKAGLTPDDLMNEENQDRLAAQLLEGRGLTAFLKGEMPIEEFANNLAKEWAALPVVNGPKKGISHHDKVGNNKAHVSPEVVLNLLSTVGEFGNLYVPEGSDVRALDVVAEQFERLSSDEPKTIDTVAERKARKEEEKFIQPTGLDEAYTTGLMNAPQSSQEPAGGTFDNIAVPQPTPTGRAPERFRTSSLAEEATALQSASGRAAPPMPANPMEGMAENMNPLLKGVPYEPGSMGRV